LKKVFPCRVGTGRKRPQYSLVHLPEVFSAMHYRLLVILLSHLNQAFGNVCKATTQTNCIDNVGQLCLDVNGQSFSAGTVICCWDATLDGSDLSGWVQCAKNGHFEAQNCSQGLKCRTDFSTCRHYCG
jgi:hypothetical protein